MTPSTLVPAYQHSARQHLTTVELVDVELNRCIRYRAGAANEQRRAHFDARVKFLTRLRGEVATPDLFTV